MSYNKADKAVQIQKQVRENINEERKCKTKDILISTIHTRIRTSFIFAIAELERIFSDLWNNENGGDLTPEQIEFLHCYKEFRKSVLDNGNAQIRAISEEMQAFEVNFVKHNIIMKPMEGQ